MRQFTIAGHQQLSKAPLMSTLMARQYSLRWNASFIVFVNATRASSAPLSGRNGNWSSEIHRLVIAYKDRRRDIIFSKHYPSKGSRLIGQLALSLPSVWPGLGISLTKAIFHSVGKCPIARHRLKRVMRRAGITAWILVMIGALKPSCPGAFLGLKDEMTDESSSVVNWGLSVESGKAKFERLRSDCYEGVSV